MRVAHTFEVVQQIKVEAIVCMGYVDPVRRRLVNAGVGVVLLCLISPAALLLGSRGGACHLLGCCRCLAAWVMHVGGGGAMVVIAPLEGQPALDRYFLL